MAFKKHGRRYDLVVFGATGKFSWRLAHTLNTNGIVQGYTGKFTAEHITTHLPTNLKWAIAGRSQEKLQKLADRLRELDGDRRQPDIEICALSNADLNALAVKTSVLISTVGPYGRYGEHAFKACAENGTHYLDCTGEVPFVARMIRKYEEVAQANGSLMFPQSGIESAPPELMTWSLARLIRSELSARTKDVTVSIHRLNAAPSGGTLLTALSIFDVFPLREFRACRRPFVLSPVPNTTAPSKEESLFSKMTGLRTIPNLGLQTTSIAALTDTPIVQRGWGLLQTIPSRRDQYYGPNFSFQEFMKPKNWLEGIIMHWGLAIVGLLLATLPPLRKFALRFVYQPGEGKAPEEAMKEDIEWRAVANPDVTKKLGKQAFCRTRFQGSMYYLTGVILAQAACTILEDELELDGGIYTPACLGQNLIGRLETAGFQFETKLIPV